MTENKLNQANWKDYFKPFTQTEDYIPDNINSNKLSSFIFFIILGFVTSLSLLAEVEGKINPIKIDRISKSKINKLKHEIDTIENHNNILESEMIIQNYNLTRLLEDREKNELIRLSPLTGSHKVIGQGIIIKISDNNKPLKTGENPNFGIVHNTDLLNIVNYLWSGGAKAISINDIRITESSGISCIGPTLLINKTRLTAPFMIKAIGEPDKLTKSLNFSNLQTLEMYGLKFSINKYDKLEVPANGTIILAGDN